MENARNIAVSAFPLTFQIHVGLTRWLILCNADHHGCGKHHGGVDHYNHNDHHGKTDPYIDLSDDFFLSNCYFESANDYPKDSFQKRNLMMNYRRHIIDDASLV